MALNKTQSEPGDALAVTLPSTADGEVQGAVIPSLSYRVSPRACTTQATQLQDRVGQFPQTLKGRKHGYLGNEEQAGRPVASG